MKRWKLIVLSLVMLLLLPGVSHALTAKQKVLVGLKGVCVLVTDIYPKAESLGLSKDQIKTDVELRLRKAGVRVLTVKEMHETPGAPDLLVTIVAYIQSNLCAFSIQVDLRELVALARGFEVTGTIWEKSQLGLTPIDQIRFVREGLGDLVDEFINDYLAANPKK
jgi:hypothetical protein